MEKVGFDQQAKEILELVGGAENVKSHTNCMTRLRITPFSHDKVDEEGLKKLDYVLQVQTVGGVTQVVIGPGKVGKVEAEFAKLRGESGTGVVDENLDGPAEKIPFKDKAIQLIQSIMMPIIGAILGAALVTALFNILSLAGYVPDPANGGIDQIMYLFKTLGSEALNYIGLFAVVSASKAFGGKPYLPMIFAIFIYFAPLDGVVIGPLTLSNGMGGIISVILITFIVIWLEKQFKKVIPDVVSTIFTPFFTVICGFIALLFIVFPIAYLFTAIIIGAINFFLQGGMVLYILGHAFIGAIWPLMVMTGTHLAASAILLPYLETDGFMPFMSAAMLFPATITGAGIASIIKYRRSEKERSINIGGTISAFLGVTEPIIYGSLLPKGRNFFLTMIAGGVGGLLVGYFGISIGFGVPGIFVVTTVTDPNQLFLYLGIWLGTALLSGLVVYIFGKKASEVE